MAESTAGIGEAGALINRATPPSTLDITRGLQMAENTALKKAQLEAARETKRQSAQAALNKYRTFKSGMYKDPSVNEKAKNIAQEMQKEMQYAFMAGDQSKIEELKQNAEFLQSDLKIEDNFLTSLAPNDKKVNTNDILIAARAGKLNEYLQTSSPLIKRYIDQDENGFPIVIRPNKYNLDKAYDALAASLGGNYVDQQLAAFNKIKVTKKVPPEVLLERAEAFVLNNEEGSAALDWNPAFQKVFKEEYNNNLEREDEAKINFVYNNLTKYNDPKYQMSSQSKEGSTFKITGNGFSIGNYNFSIIPTTTADLAETFESNKIMRGNDQVETEAFIQGFRSQGGRPVFEVVMPENASGTFVVSDPNLGKGMAKGKPNSLIEADGKAFLIYYNNDRKRGQIVEMTPKILSQMATYYKTDPDNFIKAYMSKGIDLRKYASSGNIEVKKGGGSTPPPPTVTAAQYRAMSVSEKKSFKEKGGIVK